MPSYVDFESTKHFRDFIINKTLTQPNGPQTFTADNYIVVRTKDMANVDPGAVDTNREDDLVRSQKVNTYKPNEYFITESLNTAPRKANLELYPDFVNGGYHSLIGVLSTDNYQTESELMRFAAWNIKENPEGPLYARIQQNLYAATVGRVRLIDALEGNLATATNILTGKEPLVEGNSKITVASTSIGKAIDFAQTVAGVEFPWVEIPGDYLSNPKNPVGGNVRPEAQTEAGRVLQDTTGALGSLIGVQRRPTVTRKPSDIFIEYMGYRQKQTLFDNLSYSKYAPDYTTTARSQNTSKLFNMVDNFAQSAKNFLGVEAPKGVAYIGDDRGDDVRFAMNDFNDRPVRSSYFLVMMFDSVQAELFQRKTNIGEGGGISGKLTWISSKSKNKLGANNLEFSTQKSQFEETLSTAQSFRSDSILGITQEILETMPSDGGAARSHVSNVIDQTSRIFREGDEIISRGSAIKYVDKYTQQESGVEYCRVWTKDRSYMNNSDTMKRSGNVRRHVSSVLDAPWNLNIYPNSNGNHGFGSASTNMAQGKGDGFYAKKYMFSIENLAWKMSDSPGFTYNDLPYCERGPNDGRIMWFPPYDLKMSEQNSAKWEDNTFLGRPEPVYTYQNTSRSGQVSFKVIVDHPSILNLLIKDHFKNMSDQEADNYINAFFAGCEDIDFYGLIRQYMTLTPDEVKAMMAYLNQSKNTETITRNKTIFTPSPEAVVPKNTTSTSGFKSTLYFKNDIPNPLSTGANNELYTDETYSNLYTSYSSSQSKYMEDLNIGLNIIQDPTKWNSSYIENGVRVYPIRNDYRVLAGIATADVPTIRPADSVFTTLFDKTRSILNENFALLTSEYNAFNNSLSTLKTELSKNRVQEIRLKMWSSTSPIADDTYNVKLSYRRSYAIIKDIINKIIDPSKNAEDVIDAYIIWKGTTALEQGLEKNIKFNLSELGYKQDGEFIIEYVQNVGEQDRPSIIDGAMDTSCGNSNIILSSDKLKMTAPSTFQCRYSDVRIDYVIQDSDTDAPKPPTIKPVSAEDTNIVPGKINTPPIDEMKKIIMKTLSECYYFKKLEEESPIQFSSLREKLKYFHPAFHSMTPEGLNARLTFLNQCVRPGDTLPIKGTSDVSDLNARNTTFGPPPICIMRIGDFYHSKIIIRDVNITFEENVWDLNPEGIGVQPMIANVQLQINFIGGHGLEKPVERLQNALSSNFYANTEMYDPRAIATEDRAKFYEEEFTKKFTKEFLDDLNKRSSEAVEADAKDSETSANKVAEGVYIGELKPQNIYCLYYTKLVEDLYISAETYFKNLSDVYNGMIFIYGSKILSMVLSSTYRKIGDYVVETGTGTETIQLLGEYKVNNELSVLSDYFEAQMLDKIETDNITNIMGLDKDLTAGELSMSEDIIKPIVKTIVSDMVNSIPNNNNLRSAISQRNTLIVLLDKLNFMVSELHDGKVNLRDNEYSGVNFTTSTNVIYSEYKDVVDFIKDRHIEFTEDLDESFTFGRYAVIETTDLSYFLTILLRNDVLKIMNAYKKYSGFSTRTLTKIENRINKFISPEIPPKDFGFIESRFPERKNGNEIAYNIVDFNYSFSDSQIEKLIKVHTTRQNKTTSNLNYFR